MADYPLITLLSQLDTTTPANDEVNNKMDDAIRQIKSFLATFLAQAHTDTGALKAGIIDGSMIADDTITADQIAANAVTASELADSSVDEAAIIAGAVTADKIGADAVDGTKIADNSIGLEHMQDNSVGTAELVDNAVTTAKIADGAVTASKIADGVIPSAAIVALDPAKIDYGDLSGTEPLIPVLSTVAMQWNGIPIPPRSTVNCTVGGQVAASLVPTGVSYTAGPLATRGATFQGVLHLAFSGGVSFGAYFSFREETASGADKGGAASGLNTRGTWSKTDPLGRVTFVGSKFRVSETTNGYIIASAPAYSVNRHRIFLYEVGTPDTLIAASSTQLAPAGVQSVAQFSALVSLDSDKEYAIKHYCETAKTTDGLGKACADGEPEYYAEVFFLILSTEEES